MDPLQHQFQKTKEASNALALISLETSTRVLMELADELQHQAALLLNANAKDLASLPPSDARVDRLKLTVNRIEQMAKELHTVASFPSPLARILVDKRLPNGLHIQKISVPIGVVGVIYESRPNVTVDVFALCFKSGNACLLKGGKEAHHTNTALMECIQSILKKNNIDPNTTSLLPPTREATTNLLRAQEVVDVCIPRGSQALIAFVREHAKIPIIETGAGIVHTYFDQSGDLEKGRLIIYNAKTRRVSVCNALDTLIIHRNRLSDLRALIEPFLTSHVELFADRESYQQLEGWYPKEQLSYATEADFGREFLDYKMSIKTASSIEEAVQHIQKHTSRHSEAIIAEDPLAIHSFLQHVDAAALYVNASTAFTDGAQFGMGSEIGISTQKLHARGPMGLEELTSYRWHVFGAGHIRN